MMIDPGEGYRLIDKSERRRGDEFTTDGGQTWRPTEMRAASALRGTYRRRIEKPSDEPFTLEPGKWYRTEAGRKVLVVGRLYGCDAFGEEYEFVVLDPEESENHFNTYCPNGQLWNDEPSSMGHDIIGPWPDEPTDAEIAEASRFLSDNDLYVDKVSGGGIRVYQISGEMEPISVREFVDAVAKHREEHNA